MCLIVNGTSRGPQRALSPFLPSERLCAASEHRCRTRLGPSRRSDGTKPLLQRQRPRASASPPNFGYSASVREPTFRDRSAVRPCTGCSSRRPPVVQHDRRNFANRAPGSCFGGCVGGCTYGWRAEVDDPGDWRGARRGTRCAGRSDDSRVGRRCGPCAVVPPRLEQKRSPPLRRCASALECGCVGVLDDHSSEWDLWCERA